MRLFNVAGKLLLRPILEIGCIVVMTLEARASDAPERVEGELPVSVALSLSYVSKILSYGLPDSDEPNLLFDGGLVFLDMISVGSRTYMDTTDIGVQMGRGNRRGDIWEVDFPVDVRHAFTQQEFEWLPTSVELGGGYRYEYHPKRTDIEDTQFWLSDLAFPDLWLVPRLQYERDFVRDNGTYVNIRLSHAFTFFETISLEPSVSQGWGDEKRVRGYLPSPDMKGRLDHSGLMDTLFCVAITWQITTALSLSGFVGYSDFLLDRKIRDASRNYIRQSDGVSRGRSWRFPAGIALSCVW